jgi:8-oxo-dGTP pyrophosphatase MutT (NUDIX family)
MRRRPTARVLLLDAQDRILLMRGRFEGARDEERFWFTIGGGIEPGENLMQAAAREIREETGLTDAVLGPLVWVREAVVPAMDTREPLLFQESYVVARSAGGAPSRAGWQPLEQRLVDDIRWWTLGEIAVSRELIYPHGLAELLPEILAGRFPASPRVIGARPGDA